MNEKQQQLTFEKGITNVPSDLLCSDNALEESVGMIHDDGEHRVIQKPVVYVDTETPIVPIMEGFHLLYVHKFNAEERYIGYTYDTAFHKNYLCYATKSGTNLTYRELEAPYTESTKITSIGKTLVVSDENGIKYFLWKTAYAPDLTPVYEDLGPIREPKFNFWLVNGLQDEYQEGTMGDNSGKWHVHNSGSTEGIIEYDSDFQNIFKLINRESYNNLVVGLYAKNKKSIKAEKHFCNPFFIRTAIELYDGTYTHVSQPILMMPCVTENTYAMFEWDVTFGTMNIYTTFSELHFTQTEY
jgi:hypothetical protein